MRILLADDEIELSRALSAILKLNHYDVDTACNGLDALEMALGQNYDALVLDIMMPGMSGIEVLTEIRKHAITTPVMMLTARSENQDRVDGLDSGADDYLTKPFRTEELLARIRALLRRNNDYLPEMIRFGDAVLNREESTIANGNVCFQISRRELKMLELLSVNSHATTSKEQIIRQCHMESEPNPDHLIQVYTAYLNNKFQSLATAVRIQPVPDSGYRLNELI